MLKRGLIAAIAAIAIPTAATAQISISSPFNLGGVPLPNPHPRPMFLGNQGFSEPIVPLPGNFGFFDTATGPVFFDQSGAAINNAIPPVETQFPAQPPITGNSFVPLTPAQGGTPIGAAGSSAFGPVANGPTGFVPVTGQALPNQPALTAPTSSLGLANGVGMAHRSQIQAGVATGSAVAPGFVAVTPDVLAVQPGNAIPRTSDLIDGRILSDGRLQVRWNGWNSLVDYGTVSLLDKNRNVIRSVEIDRPPLTATFTLTNKSAYYQVVIHYLNGTVTSVISPV